MVDNVLFGGMGYLGNTRAGGDKRHRSLKLRNNTRPCHGSILYLYFNSEGNMNTKNLPLIILFSLFLLANFCCIYMGIMFDWDIVK